MKKHLILCILFFTSSLQAQIGVQGSIGFGKVSEIYAGNTLIPLKNQETQLGVFTIFKRGRIAGKTGLLYKNQELYHYGFIQPEKFTGNFLEIPAQVLVYFREENANPLVANIGISLKNPIGDSKDIFTSNILTAMGGIGFEVAFDKLKVSPSVNYEYSLKPLTKANFNSAESAYITGNGSKAGNIVFKLTAHL